MAKPPTIVKVDQVSKRFVINRDKSLRTRVVGRNEGRRRQEEFWALTDVSLDVAAGSTVGLVGHNGSGKSTLLKCMGGILEPTSGTVYRRGRLAALLELGAGFHTDLTGRENVFLNAAILGLSRKETARHFDEMVAFSGVEDFIDTQVKFYSSGMYVRLAFAVAVHVDPDLLLVDEVLAVGDEPYQRKCMDKLAQFQRDGRTIVVVSHSAEQIRTLCHRVAVLDSGRLVHDGEPNGSLAVLRDQYATRARNSHRDDDVPVAGQSLPVIQLVESRVTERVGGPSVAVHVRVRIAQPVEAWALELSIDTPMGVRLFTVDSSATDVSLPTSAGEHEISIDFGQPALGAGTYLVNVGVGRPGGLSYVRALGASTFDIPQKGSERGLLRLYPEVTVEPGRART